MYTYIVLLHIMIIAYLIMKTIKIERFAMYYKQIGYDIDFYVTSNHMPEIVSLSLRSYALKQNPDNMWYHPFEQWHDLKTILDNVDKNVDKLIKEYILYMRDE